ncbi:LysR family transcriptional regulator [Acuticoccus sp. M5D2P5]|uniref:LysR family transcriptional regulator n=1 Tax=Acuticoccus kalidii TaxID=2910977 RepID=UPI001F3F7827|nr:LysR family transcriptional regulator [Acuticoccus kalidii]MCF3932821.1 LysR family transcriptional regulator [Acuticoccus kalidii]
MDRIERMQLFVRIVERGSFSGAAREMGIARSTATEAIKVLERELGAHLLARTTRHVSPTAEGEDFHRRARAILTEMEDAYGAYREETPRGRLRVNAPGLLTRTFLVPHLAAFVARYPALSIEFGQTERFVDLVRDGIDCVLRVGTPEDSSLILRPLGELPEITCASPAYLAAHGVPKTIDDLDGHHMVGFISSRTGQVMPLEFVRGGKVELRTLPAPVSADSADTTADLARAGLGLLQAPSYRFTDELSHGTLVEVLADTPPAPTPLNALYPQNRQLSRRLRVFLDWVKDIFATSL